MSRQQRALNVLRPAVTMLVVGLSLAVALFWLAAWHWAFELLTHFNFYFLLAGVAFALMALCLRQWRTAALSALIAAVSFAVVWPHMRSPPTDLQPQPGPVVRLLWANLHNWNTDLGAMRRLKRVVSP